MTRYDIIFEELQEKVASGELTLEDAQVLNDVAFEKYGDDETEYEAVTESSEEEGVTYEEYLESMEEELFDESSNQQNEKYRQMKKDYVKKHTNTNPVRDIILNPDGVDAKAMGEVYKHPIKYTLKANREIKQNRKGISRKQEKQDRQIIKNHHAKAGELAKNLDDYSLQDVKNMNFKNHLISKRYYQGKPLKKA